MTASKELHQQIDQLSPEGIKQLQLFLERQALTEKRLQLIKEFGEGWTPEEEAAFEAAMTRRPSLRRGPEQ